MVRYETYCLRLLVGSCEFLSLVLKSAQLDLELVKTAGQLGEVSTGIVQLICKETWVQTLLRRKVQGQMVMVGGGKPVQEILMVMSGLILFYYTAVLLI